MNPGESAPHSLDSQNDITTKSVENTDTKNDFQSKNEIAVRRKAFNILR